MRYGDHNAKNRELWEETQRLGGNKYRDIYQQLKNMKPKKGKHPSYCHKCGKEFGEVMHLGGDNVLTHCDYCKDKETECADCFLTGELLENLNDKLEDEFGDRCKDKNRLCATCIAWEAYDTLKELLTN